MNARGGSGPSPLSSALSLPPARGPLGPRFARRAGAAGARAHVCVSTLSAAGRRKDYPIIVSKQGQSFPASSSNAADVAAHGPAYLPLSSRAGGAETRASWRGWRVFNSTLGFAVGRLDRLDKGAVAPAKHLRIISPLQFGSLGSSRTASKRSRRPRPGSDCSPRALRRGS